MRRPVPMHDNIHDLAERARTVLAGGRHALVTLPCERAHGWVGLLDDGGEPVLLVGASSPPALGASSEPQGRVDVPGHNGERLVLTGRLRHVPGMTDTVVRRLAGAARAVVVPGSDATDVVALAFVGRRGPALPADRRSRRSWPDAGRPAQVHVDAGGEATGGPGTWLAAGTDRHGGRPRFVRAR